MPGRSDDGCIDARSGESKLRIMTRCRTLQMLIVSAATVTACERGAKAPAAGASTAAGTTTAATAAPAAGGAWNAELGPALLVQGQAPNEALVILAQGASENIGEQQAIAIRSTPAVLLGHGDSVQVGVLQAAVAPTGRECVAWPVWQVTRAPAQGSTIAPWSVGFTTSRAAAATPVPLDSVETLSSADSARIAAEVTRLASVIPAAGSTRFEGLPFTVMTLWRFRAAPATEGVVATLVRRLNQEARPFEERTFLIAERDSTRRDAPYELAYHERSEGTEETNETTDILGAVRLAGASEPTMVVVRDYGDGTAYALVERDGPAHWRVRWSSRRARC